MASDKNKKPVKPAVVQITDPEERKKALATAMAQIEKVYGAGSVMFLGENKHLDVEAISSGSLTLDLALGIGGFPRGRIIEVYGAESSGKTTVALHTVAEAQKNGGEAAFIDVEHALDPVYARNLGVDIDKLIVSQPDTGEQALEIIEALVRSGAVDVIVLDSVAAMVTRGEIEGGMGDAHVGVQARLMSSALRKLTSIIGKSNCIVIFINQLREKIGVSYGNPEVTPGGRALKFYSSVRVEVKKGETLKDATDQVGKRTKCKVVKNKIAPPFKECEFDIVFGEGISKVGEILDLSVDMGIAKKGGSWYSYNDMKLGQGREKSKKFLKENPDIMKELEDKIRADAEKAAEIATNRARQTLDEDEGLGDEIAAIQAKLELAEQKKKSKGKKTVIIEAEDDFEEFSPEDLE